MLDLYKMRVREDNLTDNVFCITYTIEHCPFISLQDMI